MEQVESRIPGTQRITWMMTHWCHNSCDYCGVPVFRKKPPIDEKIRHAFAVQPVDRWLKCLRPLLDRAKTYLKITGGEAFLDRRNFPLLLAGLLSHPNLIGLRVDTTGFFSPRVYDAVPKERFYLNVSYHPSQATLRRFLKRLYQLAEHGFAITMINYVLAPGQYERFEAVREELEGRGFFVNASPMIPAGKYLGRTVRDVLEVEIIKKYNPPLDAKYRLSPVRTRGRLCRHPCKSYFLDFDGRFQVECSGTPVDFFTEQVPKLPDSPAPCPRDTCTGCYEMYRELLDEPYTPPDGVFGLAEYVDEVKTFRAANSHVHLR